jgi:5'-nucleotidase
MNQPIIFLTNDDGIHSPGLKASVQGVLGLGRIIVAAPSKQQTAMSRSIVGSEEAKLEPVIYDVAGNAIEAYTCDCSPALIVQLAYSILFQEQKPDLTVSGINYGENIGSNVNVSGTVGAALESASRGTPALAISKQTDTESHFQYTEQDWHPSIFFLNQFANQILSEGFPKDIDVLKIDIPAEANENTECELAEIADQPYYHIFLDSPTLDSKIGDIRVCIKYDKERLSKTSDIYVLAEKKHVAVCPMRFNYHNGYDLTTMQYLLKSSSAN